MANPEGVDISSVNGRVDFAAMKDSGINFVVTKATQGTGYTNPQFKRSMNECRRLGIIVGAYHFLHYGSRPADEAKHFLDVLKSVDYGRKGDLPPMVDVETARDGAGGNPTPQYVAAFLEAVERATGKPAAIYTYPSCWREYMGNTRQFAGHNPLWIASYQANRPALVGGWSAHTLWQYSATGYVSGIAGRVDRDRFNGTLTELQGFAGIGVVPPPPVPVPVPVPQPAPDVYHDPVTDQYVAHGFLAYWQAHPYLGHPLTGEYAMTLEDGNEYTVQLFERGLLQYRPGEQVAEARIGWMYEQLAERGA